MRICLFGGTGFIGSRLAALLAEAGHELVVPARDRERCKRDLIVLPGLDLVQCDVLEPKSIDRVIRGCSVAVNLVGILNEGGRHTFESVHIEFNRKLAEIAARHKVRQLVYVSAINASTGAPSKYLRSKGKAEAIVKSVMGGVRHTIIRPSVVFGAGDSFTALFARLLGLFPVMALPCPGAKFQPIWVDDLARLVAFAIGNRDFHDTVSLAGGPETMDLRAVIDKIAAATGRRRPVVPLGRVPSLILAKTAEMLPFVDMLSVDNCDSMSVPSVCGEQNAAERHLGTLMSLDAELGMRFGHSSASRFRIDELRHQARR